MIVGPSGVPAARTARRPTVDSPGAIHVGIQPDLGPVAECATDGDVGHQERGEEAEHGQQGAPRNCFQASQRGRPANFKLREAAIRMIRQTNIRAPILKKPQLARNQE